MTPQEKAKELRDKMYLKIPSVYDPTGLPHYPISKEMALIAVDEIINSFKLNTGIDIVGSSVIEFAIKNTDYWNEVKHEINKL